MKQAAEGLSMRKTDQGLVVAVLLNPCLLMMACSSETRRDQGRSMAAHTRGGRTAASDWRESVRVMRQMKGWNCEEGADGGL
eukprot:1078035-Rhodomonas_salina.1